MPQLSVIIPAYNEESRLGSTLDLLLAYLAEKRPDAEVIVVDDGSTDGTRELTLQKSEVFPNLRILSYRPNRGKGHAVKRGVMEASGEIIVFYDADASTPIDQIEKIQHHFDSGADVVIGSRSLPDSDVRVRQPWYRENMGRVFNYFVRALILDGIVDTQCGFKAFRRHAAREVFSRQCLQGFSFDVELLFIARKLGFVIHEAPIVWVNSPSSRVHPLWDSIRMFLELLKIRWNSLCGIYKNGKVPS